MTRYGKAWQVMARPHYIAIGIKKNKVFVFSAKKSFGEITALLAALFSRSWTIQQCFYFTTEKPSNPSKKSIVSKIKNTGEGGFEPPIPFKGMPVFKTDTLNRSDTHPL